jgi:hypothetical protein
MPFNELIPMKAIDCIGNKYSNKLPESSAFMHHDRADASINRTFCTISQKSGNKSVEQGLIPARAAVNSTNYQKH